MTSTPGTPVVSDLEFSDSYSTPSPAKSQSTSKSSAEKAASSQNAKIAGTNRRKSGHHRIIQDDDISFETVILLTDDNMSTELSNSQQTLPHVPKDSEKKVAKECPVAKKPKPTKMPSADEFIREENGNSDENPNHVLMKKAAFLRVSVNYLMMNLGRTPFDFSRQRALSELVGEYNRKNRLAQAKRRDSGGSSRK